MSNDTKKTLGQINAEVQRGSSVVAAVEPEMPTDACETGEKKVDAVTSATQKNNIYLPPMPVMMPPPLPKKKIESE